MEIQLDGRQSLDHQRVTIIVKGAGPNGEDELHLCINHEGLILDLVDDGEIIATAGYDYSELEELCH